MISRMIEEERILTYADAIAEALIEDKVEEGAMEVILYAFEIAKERYEHKG